MSIWRKFLSLMLAAVMCVTFFPSVSAGNVQLTPIGRPVASWSATSLEGEKITESTYKDKIQVIVFFKSSGDCLDSNNTLEGIAESSWVSADDIQVIATDAADGNAETISDFRDKHAKDCSDIVFVYDDGDSMDTLRAAADQTGVLPVSIVIDKENKIQYSWSGSYVEDNYTAAINAIRNGIKPFTITFDANGGVLTGDASISTGFDGTLPSLPKEPLNADPDTVFDGWYTSADGGDKITEGYQFSADTTVYAHWKKTEAEPGTTQYKDSGGGTKLSKSEITNLLETNSLALPEKVFDTEPSCDAPYSTGKVTSDALQAAVNRLNAMRRIAGLPDTQLDITLSEKAQYSAVTNAANGNISHTPERPAGMDDDFYSKACEAAGRSNLSAGSSLTKAVDRFMDDSDQSNIDRLGHRRWQINPTLGKVGFGLAKNDSGYGSYVTEWVFDKSGSGCNYDFIAWPSSGCFPNDIFDKDYAWSVTLNPAEYDAYNISNISVTVTRNADNKSWNFSGSYSASGSGKYFNVNNGGYGVDNCIIFRPDGIDTYDGLYTVTIDGLKNKTGEDVQLAYQVEFFNAGTGSNTPVQPQPKAYTVLFNANGGNLSGVEIFSTDSNGRLSSFPSDPSRSGYKFDGWYTSASGGAKISAGYTFTDNTTIYAHWAENTSKKYTVTFDANGGKLNGSSSIVTGTDGKLSSLPSDPTRSGYKFDGWYTSASGGAKISASYTFTDNTTIYAHWAENTSKKYTVTFDANGGKLNGSSSIVTGTDGKLSSLPSAPTRSGYKFDGWYTNISNGQKVSSSYVFTEDTRVYAHWTADNVSVGNDNGGVPDNSGNNASTGNYPTSVPVFSDVPDNVFFAEAVNWAVQKGITSGTTPGTFSPYNSCTRAQTVTFLWRAAGSPTPKTNNNPFTDVAPGLYYYDAVLWALENNITSGATATTFNPSGVVTRAQTVTFLYRSMGSPSIDDVKQPFYDVADNLYFSDAVKWATAQGITSGTTDTTFSPFNNCTRGQIVTFLHRAEQV